ncbi:MAG: hypothetical protein ACXW2E_10555, partial [Nitrososphaeraceae archaeon]
MSLLFRSSESDLFITSTKFERQGEAIYMWEGKCDQLKGISQDTLVVTGTDDLVLPSANSMILTEK